LIFIKLGVVLLLAGFSYVWLLKPSAQQWSWVRQLGTASLLVYWVHIELVYGHWLGWMKLNLDVTETVLVAAGITAAMVGLAWINTSWPQWRAELGEVFASGTPQRVSGD
jgi:fucose 4-O-acetylase-like acetyltransferase